MSTSMAETTSAAPAPMRRRLMERVADRWGVDADKLASTLKATAFRQSSGAVSNEQLMALMVVAEQHRLNPFTKEIYAFPDKGGVVPVVSIDGWVRIMQEHPQYDGVEFVYSEERVKAGNKWAPEWIEAVIYRKDQQRPTRAREFFEECSRSTGPWQSHPKRMLRHKALIQGARTAFGFAGIYDEDEASRIVDVNPVVRPASQVPESVLLEAERASEPPPEPEPETVEPKAPDGVDPETGEVLEPEPAEAEASGVEAPPVTPEELLEQVRAATSADDLALCEDLLSTIKGARARKPIVDAIADAKRRLGVES